MDGGSGESCASVETDETAMSDFVHIVIGGVGGEEIEVYTTLLEAQRRCGALNTERAQIYLQAQYDHRVVSCKLRRKARRGYSDCPVPRRKASQQA